MQALGEKRLHGGIDGHRSVLHLTSATFGDDDRRRSGHLLNLVASSRIRDPVSPRFQDSTRPRGPLFLHRSTSEVEAVRHDRRGADPYFMEMLTLFGCSLPVGHALDSRSRPLTLSSVALDSLSLEMAGDGRHSLRAGARGWESRATTASRNCGRGRRREGAC